MSKPKYKFGDRIQVHSANKDFNGRIGYVDYVMKNENAGGFKYRILFDDHSKWWFAEFYLSLHPTDNKFHPTDMLIVMTDGKETRAITKQNGKIIHDVTLRRHPDDEPNLLNAAKYAVERIERISKRKEKPPVRKPLNMDVVCVENHGLDGVFTIGKVYHIKDGRLSYDGRNSCDSAYGVYFSLSDLNDCNHPHRTAARFIEYKGGA